MKQTTLLILSKRLKYGQSNKITASIHNFKVLGARCYFNVEGYEPEVYISYQSVEGWADNSVNLSKEYVFEVLRDGNVIPNNSTHVASAHDQFRNIYHIFQRL